MKFLLYEIVPRAGFNLATGRMIDIPDLECIMQRREKTLFWYKDEVETLRK